MTRRILNKKVRQCQTCGHTTDSRYNSHKVWDKKNKRMKYCGYMRVVRE